MKTKLKNRKYVMTIILFHNFIRLYKQTRTVYLDNFNLNNKELLIIKIFQ